MAIRDHHDQARAYAELQAHMLGASTAQTAAAHMQPQQVEALGILAQAMNALNACHKMLDDLHKFADQYVGIRNEADGRLEGQGAK